MRPHLSIHPGPVAPLGFVTRLLLIAAVLVCLPAPVALAQAAPDGTPLCSADLHARHTVKAGGRSWPTWHPPYDAGHGCAYGHEHGSSPRAFRYFRRSGMPAFGRTGAFAGNDEVHAGFKVFAANDDGRGLAWVTIVHQGSGSPRRGVVRFHSLEAWLFRRRDRRLIAHTRQMADFGPALANCRSTKFGARYRLLPHPRCGAVTERWGTRLNVGGVMRAQPAFETANPLTQFDPANPAVVIPNKARACGAGGWASRCKGDRRLVLHPRWVVKNRGPSRFHTDAFGKRARRGLPQFVSRGVRVDQDHARRGPANTFVMRSAAGGGIYRARSGRRSAGFESPRLCVLGPN